MIMGLQLSDYKNINQMGKESVSTYIKRIVITYHNFFDISNISMFPFRIRHIYIFILLLCIYLLIYQMYKLYQYDKFRIVILLLCIVIFPLTSNFIFVMCDEEYVSCLMLYGQVAVYILFAFLLDKTFFF